MAKVKSPMPERSEQRENHTAKAIQENKNKRGDLDAKQYFW